MTNNCQFHQEGNYIHVLIKGKDITRDDLDVQIQRRRLTVTLNKVTLVEGLLQGQVDVGNCKVNFHSDYAEIKLRKANQDEMWPQLLLGVPDMMTSLQRAQQQTASMNTAAMDSSMGSPAAFMVSPETSPTRRKSVVTTPKTVVEAGVDAMNMSLSNFVHKVFTPSDDQMEMRDDAVEA